MLGTPYLRILRLPGIATLLAATLVARIPDGITATGIVILVRLETGSYPAAGFAAAAFGIGTAVSAPLTGRALDRLGQRRVLSWLAAGFSAVLVMLAGGGLAGGGLGAGGLAALSAVAGLLRPPVEAALRAMWPRLVPSPQVDAAYALDSTAQEFIWIGGPLLLAALLTTGSPRLPLLACAVASVVGTAAYVMNPHLAAPTRSARTTAPSPLRRPAFRVLLAAAACYGVAAGMLNLALVAFAAQHGAVAWAGILVAIWGGGSLAGGIAFSRDWPGRPGQRAMTCLALFGAALALLAAAPGLVALALLMLPLGLPLSPWLGSLSAGVQRAVPTARSAEAFAWTFAVITVGISAGNALGGLIIQRATPRAAFLIAGALALAGAAAGALRDLSARRAGGTAR